MPLELSQSYQTLASSGYIVVDVPADVFDHTQEAVLSSAKTRVRSGPSLTDAAVLINHLSNDAYRRLLGAKENRIIRKTDCTPIVKWAERLVADIFPGSNAQCSILSSADQARRPDLERDNPDFFYRCVRPGSSDVGPAHRDCDFWKAYEGTDLLPSTPSWAVSRWKLWMPISGCDENNSLQVLPRSHLEDPPVEFTVRDGKPSARLDKDYVLSRNDDFLRPFSENAESRALLFHDKVIHRGPPNSSNHLRISRQMTIPSSAP